MMASLLRGMVTRKLADAAANKPVLHQLSECLHRSPRRAVSGVNGEMDMARLVAGVQ